MNSRALFVSCEGARVKGTKLWYAAGSPLIQGRSRRERPISTDLFIAWALASMIAGALGVIAAVYKGSALSSVLLAAGLPLVIASGGGAIVGVGLARGYGWHPRWAAGVGFGVLLGIVAIAIVLW